MAAAAPQPCAVLDAGLRGADDRAGRALEHLGDVVESADGRPVTAAAGELAGRLDLGQHRAGRELRGQGVQGIGVGACDGPLGGLAPVDVGGVSVGGHDEVVGLDAGGQQSGGMVLVDDRLHADQLAVRTAVDGRSLVVGVHDRDAAAAGADDDGALLQQPADLAQLEDAHGLGRRHHAAVVVAVRLEGPALLGRHGVRRGLVVDRADGLARILEGRVVDVDLDHRQQRRQRLVEGHQVAQLLLDEVADHALRLRAQDVERVGRHLRVGRALERQQADLRSVAVGDDQLVLGWPREPARCRRCWTFWRWFSLVMASPRRSRALPPRATTTLMRACYVLARASDDWPSRVGRRLGRARVVIRPRSAMAAAARRPVLRAWSWADS